jgi:dTDP-glucose 4,6-dehydratase
MTRHVVTGGAGFVGQYLVRALQARGEQVVIFDQRVAPGGGDVEFVAGDIRSRGDLAWLRLGPDDIVHHLAARQFHGAVPRRGREAWFADVNTGGTQALLAAMAAGGARRLVFLSTDMTYGPPETTPVLPDHPQRPIGPYGRSKCDAEALIRSAAERDGLRATIFRPRLIAGAGRLGILAKLFRLIARGLPVPMIGGGQSRYQMIAVEDVVAAMLRAVELGLPPGPYNLGSEAPPTVQALLQALIARAGSRSMLVPTPGAAVQGVLALLDRLGLTLLYPEQFAIADLDYVLDTTRTRAELGWVPARRDAEILFDAYAHFRSVAGARDGGRA